MCVFVRCFVQIGNRSSVYSAVGTVRKTGSFVYEDFMPTDGTDVKVLTVYRLAFKRNILMSAGAKCLQSLQVNVLELIMLSNGMFPE